MDTFRPFSATHGAVIVAFAVFTTGLVMLGRRWNNTPRGRAFDQILAVATFVPWMIINIWWLLPENFDAQQSLPIHVCDIIGLVVPIALLTRWRWSRALLYFWGIGFSTQGFFTPVLRDGPATWKFYAFWVTHFEVVGIAIYDLAARGFRPGWRDFAIAGGAGVVYVAIMVPLNVWLGANYGYVGPTKPETPTLLDALGPWPWRPWIVLALAELVMFLMTLPWVITGSLSRYSGRGVGEGSLG